jgi:hypothetical protein
MLFNSADLHPSEVVRIVGIYPACDLCSYPVLTVTSKACGMTDQKLEAQLKRHNPVDLMSGLTRANVHLDPGSSGSGRNR